jgi:hypothetical protein
MRAMVVARPSAGFLDHVLAPFGGQSIETCLAIVRGHTPFVADPFLGLQPLQSRVERTMIDEENILRIRLNGTGNPLAVLGTENKDSQDQEVEGTLQQSDPILFLEVQHVWVRC